MKKLDKKGFTLIEVIVVVAIIGILVLLGSPRLLGYTQKAELTRIQHDVKVMENEMGEVLSTNNQEFGNFQNNGKDLGRVVMRKELFEKKGVAKNINWEHLSTNWMYANSNPENEDDGLGMGGDLIEIEVDDKYSTYKIIPKEFSHKINTKLKGTFYVNSLGKVYYEHDKPLNRGNGKESLACVAPESLGYEFEIISDLGTITGWNGNATHLVIPASFKMSEGDKEWCEPVRVIGAGAFQNGTFKRVTIPQSVETIEDEAFQGGQLIEIKVPHSVITIGDNAFSGNPATSSGGSGSSGGSDGSGGSSSSVTVKGSSDGRNISDSAFGGFSFTYAPVTDKDLDVVVRTKVNSNGGKTASIVGRTSSSISTSLGGTSLSYGGNSLSSGGTYNTVINIPKELEINGEILPVTEIEKGAFQGSGLIDVIMPEGLLYIHDYAFAGNQLIRALIPNSVIEIGNYAFAYNEINDKPTIDPIDILESKFTGNFGYVNNEGNISQPVSTINLKSHIFIISSMGNHVIEDIGANPEQPEDNNDEDVNDDVELMNPIDTREPVEGEIAIDSAEELAKIGKEYPLNGKYILTSDIDLSGINWVPIGNNSSNNSRFKGSFDGNGYNITGLTINRPETSYVGLFGYTEGATISNVALEDIKVEGRGSVGGLVGYAGGGTIENSYVTGSVTGTVQVGGLVGRAFSGIKISNSYATGTVTGTEQVGGLVGYASSEIRNSHATGQVTGTGEKVGGLVGYAASSTTISNSYTTGAVTGNDNIGGLVGWAYNSTIENSYSTVDVTAPGIRVGGLVGVSSSTTISNSYATGSVTGRGNVGGLVGEASSSAITNSYATVSVTGSGENVGGLVGYASDSEIENSYATRSVKGTGDYVGGLVGQAYKSTISNSYSTGAVTPTSSNNNSHGIGGLVGIANSSTISKSYATGSARGYQGIGGLVGIANGSTIENSYATGRATSTSWGAGGLLGRFGSNPKSSSSTISNSYATGPVRGKDKVGGLVGSDISGGRVINSYWDTETTGRPSSVRGGIGKSTDDMKFKGTYSSWDFDTVWKIEEGNDYPKLR